MAVLGKGRNGNYWPKLRQGSPSSGREGISIAEQFQQIVSGADQFPLALDADGWPSLLSSVSLWNYHDSGARLSRDFREGGIR